VGKRIKNDKKKNKKIIIIIIIKIKIKIKIRDAELGKDNQHEKEVSSVEWKARRVRSFKVFEKVFVVNRARFPFVLVFQGSSRRLSTSYWTFQVPWK
jgi:hypothetical protein